MLKQVGQIRQIKCNFCNKNIQGVHNYKNYINLCFSCIQKIMKNPIKIISKDQQIYQLIIIKRNKKIDIDHHQINYLTHDKQNIDNFISNDKNTKIMLIWQYLLTQISKINPTDERQLDKYLRHIKQKFLKQNNQINNFYNNQNNSILSGINQSKIQDLSNLEYTPHNVSIQSGNGVGKESKDGFQELEFCGDIKQSVDLIRKYQKCQKEQNPAKQKEILVLEQKVQQRTKVQKQILVLEQKGQSIAKVQKQKITPLKSPTKTPNTKKVVIELSNKKSSQNIPLLVLPQPKIVQNPTTPISSTTIHEQNCPIKSQNDIQSKTIQKVKNYSNIKKQANKANSTLLNSSVGQIKPRLTPLDHKNRDHFQQSIFQPQPSQQLPHKLHGINSTIDVIIPSQKSHQSIKINRNRHYDLQIVGKNRIKQKIYTFLQANSLLSPCLYLVKTLEIYDVLQNTNSVNRCIQLIAYNIQHIDIKCYLSMIQWTDIDVLKLVKVGLNDEQFVQVLNVIKDKKIQTLVVSNNKLTDLSINALKFYNKKLTYIKNIYLGSNKIQKCKFKDQIQKIQKQNKFILFM